MRIAICDDQAVCLEQTRSAIQKCLPAPEAHIELFKSGIPFLRAFQEWPFDLVFLDIEMPEINGISLAKNLRKLHKDVPIIFLTSHIEYALEGYEVNALRYLTKPLDPGKLRDVLTVVAERMRRQKHLWIKTDQGDQRVLVSGILYMEAQNQNILIRTRQNSFRVRYNLSNYEDELSRDGFFRTHRGYLVSLAHIKTVGKSEVTLDDNTTLPVSRSREKELKEALFQYIQKEAL